MSPATTSSSAGLPDRMARIALGLLVAPGNSETAAIVRAVGAVEAFTRIVAGTHTSQSLTDAVHARLHTTGVNLPSDLTEATAARVAEQLADRAIRHADQLGARIVTAADDEWPQGIEDLHALPQDNEPPLCLWLRGPARLNETLRLSVSIVGARAMTSYGQFVASELAYGLAERGWTIVSGGALGL